MPRWMLFAVLPLLAAVLVFGPALLQFEPADAGSNTTAAAPVTVPEKPEKAQLGPFGRSTPSASQIGTSLVLVLALAVFGIVVLRRMQTTRTDGGTPSTIELKESRRLGKGRALHYLRVGDRLLLIAESECGVQMLRDLTPSEGVDVATDDHVDEWEDDGATPRDLLPTPRAGGRTASRTAARKAKLGDFRALLGKLG
ncbi:MAG: FliO/MopB family protein [Planctomycetes bacterium]|nr:FliO/MopB family protein [Planctomycetota bacterium]